MWSKVSGPGEVMFADPTNTTTVVTFSQSGIYVLRLRASDSVATSSADVSIMVNQAPLVDAGLDQTGSLGGAFILHGTVIDDGLPGNDNLRVSWSLVSGPDSVLFGDPCAPITSVGIVIEGIYIFRLTATDGLATNSDDTVLVVKPANRPPVVWAGQNQMISLSSNAVLRGVVTDDGLPEGVPLTFAWSKVSGPGEVIFGDPTATNTTAMFGEPGTYMLRLTASDSILTGCADVCIMVRTQAVNEAPMVSAGPDKVIGLTNVAVLEGIVVDDGLPQSATIAVLWSKVSGPGNVVFHNPATTNTCATFSEVGTYVLRLTATDSALTASDEVAVTVYPFNHPPEVYAGPDQDITLPDPAYFAGDGKTLTNANISLGRSLSDAPRWNNAMGQPGLDGMVWLNSIAIADEIFVTGRFQHAGTNEAHGSARWNGSEWLPLYDPRPYYGGNYDPTVTNIAYWVFDCGTFEFCSQTLDCVGARGREAFVGGLGKELGEPDGYKDMTARWSGTGWESWVFKEAGNHVRVIVVTSNMVYLGGHFAFQPTNATYTEFPDLPWSYCVATWDGTNWGTLGSGIVDIRDYPQPNYPARNIYHAYVNCLAVGKSGEVYVAGDFIMATPTGYATNVAKWNGQQWEPLGGGLPRPYYSSVDYKAMALAEDGNLYVSGTFTNAGGVAATNIARWDGQRWHALPGVTSGSIRAIAVHGNNVYVGGQLSSVGGLEVRNIARWDGLQWHRLGYGNDYGVNGQVFSLAVDDTGLYVGGSFTEAGGLPANNIAKWEFPKPLPRFARLEGRVTDDGLPVGSALSTIWTKVSGPGEVTFADPHSPVTTATFSKPGTYVLRLSADDSEFTTIDEVTIIVRGNQPPVVDAGPDQVIGISEAATLTGTITDDGLPEGALIGCVWTLVNGPGTATFGNQCDPHTTVRFSAQGVYVLRLTANDSQFTVFDDVVITVTDVNQAPYGHPGQTRYVPFAVPTTITASSIYDDGRPINVTNILWSQVSGPGTASFSHPTNATTTVTFSLPGTYVLRLTVNDSELSSFMDVTIHAVLGYNSAPEVNAGPTQIISNLVTQLQGSVIDDGLPAGVPLNVFWTKVSGPGTVTFVDSNSPVTWVRFSAPGNYLLQLTASDSQYTRSSTVSIQMPNQRPVVNAGPDRTIVYPTMSLLLTGAATDDGQPWPTPTATWSKVSGPGTVTFSNFKAFTNTVTFSSTGTYVLRLSAYDGTATSTDDLTVVVAPPGNQPPNVNAGDDIALWWPSNSLVIYGTVTDDNLPSGSSITTVWTKVSGPGEVVFGDPMAPVTMATFSQVGTYVLRLTADDSVLTNGDDVVVQVLPPLNQPPMVSAGTNQIIRLTNEIVLVGTVNDDGLPLGSTVQTTWRKISGPGPVYFTGATNLTTNLNTIAKFVIAGDYVLRLTSSDSEFSVYSDVTITVLPPDDNIPPTVNAGPDISAMQFLPVTLAGFVNDDGLPADGFIAASWSRISGPGTVYFSNAAATNTTATFYATGQYVLRLTATDGRATSYDDVMVTVMTPVNQPPLPLAGPDLTVTRPHAAYLGGVVLDDDLPVGYPLLYKWAKLGGPGTVKFVTTSGTNANSTPWEAVDVVDALASATFSTNGTYVLQLIATDTQYTNTDEITITVLPGVNSPSVVDAGLDQAIALPSPAILHTYATDDGLENGVLQITWSKVSGPGPVWFSTVNYVYRATFTTPGEYVLRLTAFDGALSDSDDVTITVFDAPPPIAEIVAPADSSVVTAPTEVVGTVSSPILESYVVEYRPVRHESLSPPQDWVVIASGTNCVISNTVAVFDPTLLLNGIYELRLTTTDTVGRSTTTEPITLIVDRNLKIGHFTISFSDLTVPVAGIPIEIIRTYDSRDNRTNDFGIGWSLGIRNVRVQKNRPIAPNWESGGGSSSGYMYYLDPVRPRIVTITFPDGRTYKFEARPVPEYQWGYPITAATIVYRPLDNTHGTLVSLSPDGDDVLVDGWLGNVNLFDYSGDPYEPTRFKFTSDEGDVYILDMHQGLEQVMDRNGNTLTITTNGIFHSSGVGVTFTRDAQGRITSITDPAGNVLRYTYATNGCLATFTDRENFTVTYGYTNTAYPHYLTDITDPRGIKALRTEYDATGRMIRQIDAAGNVVEFTHDLSNNREIIRDRLGNVTIHEYDNRGNIIRTIDPLGNVTLRKYDAFDNEIENVDALGNTNRFTYDSRGNKLTETDPLGNTTRYTYGPYRELTSITNPRGFTTTNLYDANGNLIEMRDALGNATRFTYDSRGNLITQTDPLGNITSNRYDSLGRLVYTVVLDSQHGPISGTWFTYDANGNQTTRSVKRTTAAGVQTLTTTYIYDKENRLVQTIHPDGSSNTTVYAIGLDKPAVEIDPLGRQTLHFYDERGNLTNTVYPDGTSESWFYDAENRKIAETDRAGRATYYVNDPLGRLVVTVYPDGTGKTNFYDPTGRLSATTDALGNPTFYGYDAAGRNVAVTNAWGQVTFYEYDASGNRTAMIDTLGRTNRFVYDALDRCVQTVFPDGTTRTTWFDALGRRTYEQDQAGKVTAYGYDALGRLTAVTNALGYVTSYAYDELGQQINQTDANGHTTTFEYDSMGRRIKRTLPGGQVETYQYDLAGNLVSKTDFNGYTTSYQYDSMNRLVAKIPDPRRGEPPVTYAYNELGLRTKMLDASGVTQYRYDVRGRLVQKLKTWTAVGLTVALNYTHDACGNLTGIESSSPNGVSLAYTYDALNRLESVTDAHTGTTTYSYDAVGNLAGYVYPNGVASSYEYDSLNRLTNLSSAGAQGTPVAWYRYTVLPTGHRQTASENVNTPSGVQTINRLYSYDATYRLVNESYSVTGPLGLPPSANVSYTLDAVGNRLSRVSKLAQLPSESYGYDANDRLTSDTYDDNGNTLVGRESTRSLLNCAYDFEDRLVTATTADGKTITILYDGDGNRVAKTVTTPTGSVTTLYVVDDQNPTGYAQVLEEHVSHESSAPTLRAVYVYGNDLISQLRLVEDDQGGVQWVPSFYGYDGHGNTRYLTDINGLVTDTYDYDAFGNLISRTGDTPNNYLYCGEQLDPDLGLYFLRARYLNPDTGRFWTRDPHEGFAGDPLSLHRYLYAKCDPANGTDPSGFFTIPEVTISTLIDRINNAVHTLNLVRAACKVRTAINAAASIEFWTAVSGMITGVLLNPTSFAVGTELITTSHAPDSLLKSASLRIYGTGRGLKYQFALDMKDGSKIRVNWTPGGEISFEGGGNFGKLENIKVCGVSVVEAELTVRAGISVKPGWVSTARPVGSLGVQVVILNLFRFQVKLLGEDTLY